MKTEWKKTQLGDVIEIHDSRRIPLSGAQRSQRPGKYPYYGAQSIIDYIDDYIFDGKFLLIAEDGENLRSRKEPIASFASGQFWVNNHAHIVTAKPELADDYFIKACLNHANLAAYVTGAAQPKLSQGNLKQIEINLPSLPTQRKIAGILSAYDDLIENNLRRIKILEQMAQSLYREWFVHFRFPGHESAKYVDSELGQIPKGWGVSDLEKVTTKIGSGATPRGGKDSYKPDGITLIRSMNIYDYSFEFDSLAFIDPKQAAQLDNVSVEAHDVLLNITGASVCRCAMVPSYLLPARVNQHVAIIRAKTEVVDPHFLLDSINSEQNKKTLFSLAQGGATREALTKETICRFQILLPQRDLIFRYGRIAGAMHTQREGLQRQNQTLRRTRDLLLPKLLAGDGASFRAGNPPENLEKSPRNT
jgi:type I restriction enzyme S subunit